MLDFDPNHASNMVLYHDARWQEWDAAGSQPVHQDGKKQMLEPCIASDDALCIGA